MCTWVQSWLNNWVKDNSLTFKVSKCKYMLIYHKRQGSADFLLDNLILECFNYLGVILTSDLLWSSHVESIGTKSQNLLGLLYRRFYKCAEPSALVQLYHSLVRPHLEYASDVWDPHLKRDIQLIENVQKFGLRICSKQWDLGYNELCLISVFLTFTHVDYITSSAQCLRLYIISSLFLHQFLYLAPVDASLMCFLTIC